MEVKLLLSPIKLATRAF